jgi:excisionase family DNA binding protein
MPQKSMDAPALVESVLHLRRAERIADDAVRREIEPVLNRLEAAAGPSVSRAEAARLLGVSQTALDRWIAKGDIAAVTTPRGRREIPLSHLLDLLELVEQRREQRKSLALASVIRDRRREAAELDESPLLKVSRPPQRTHRSAEIQALAYHRVVAQRLDEQLVGDASKRLDRWRREGKIREQWADEWQRVLEMPLPRIAKLISSDTERARELRQSSPFAGALTEQERRRLQDVVIK